MIKRHNLLPPNGEKLNETKFVENDPLIILANTTIHSAPEYRVTMNRAMFCKMCQHIIFKMQTPMFQTDLSNQNLWNWGDLHI